LTDFAEKVVLYLFYLRICAKSVIFAVDFVRYSCQNTIKTQLFI